MVERNLAKVEVAGSSLVIRSSAEQKAFCFQKAFCISSRCIWKTWYLWNAGGSACRFGMAAALFREDRSFPNNSPGGGIGRRAGLKIQWAVMPVRVRFPSRVLFTDRLGGNFSIKPLFFKPLHIQPPFHFPRFYPFIYHPIYHLKDFYTSARGYFPARQGARKKHSGAT